MPRSRKNRRLKSFAGIPRDVVAHPDFKDLPGNAAKLLVILAGQYKGKNNGDLTASWSVLDDWFNSKGTLQRAVKSLIDANLIIKTREGRFCNPGSRCALYALTWVPIDECQGKDLEVKSSYRPRRVFGLEKHLEKNNLPTPYSEGGGGKNGNEK